MGKLGKLGKVGKFGKVGKVGNAGKIKAVGGQPQAEEQGVEQAKEEVDQNVQD